MKAVAEPWPVYLGLDEKGWEERIAAARALLAPCRLCPRACGVDRLAGEQGVCRAGATAEVSSYSDHHGEELPLSGSRGSGTIFFTHCNLRCVFCQNYPISHLGDGEVVSAERLAEMMLRLQRRGCHNINFVTPTHVMPFILEALTIAVKKGLRLPLVYNCGGYESLEAVKILDGIVDIYLPDMKYNDNAVAQKLSGAPDYVERNREALREMHRQVGDLVTDEDGIALRGLIIRHLVMPNGMAGSEGILLFIARELSPQTAVSLLSQYFPAYKACDYPEIARRLHPEEYKAAVKALRQTGLENGLVQDRRVILLFEE